MSITSADTTAAQVAAEIRRRERFVVASHMRPDGDAIGSSMAMALALRQLGKQARVVSHDQVPPQMQSFPGIGTIDVVDRVDDPGDAVLVMECGDIQRTGVAGLEHGFVVNIDHHPGNTQFGSINWLDLSAAACGEMVFTLIQELGAPLTEDIATYLYVALMTDTGGFRYANITPRTFDISRQCVEAGVNPSAVADSIYNSNSLSRLRLYGAILHRMRLDPTSRIATLRVDQRLVTECGGTYEDTEGLVNLPLTVKDIVVVAFFKENGPGEWRVSMRSKGDIDVNRVAREFGGGGHRNASGCSVRGSFDELQALFEARLSQAISLQTP